MPNPVIDEADNRVWQNWHSTSGIGGTAQKLFTPHNTWDDGSTTPGKAFQPGLVALQQIVQKAEANKKRVRALGSGWSMSAVAFVEDYLIDTSRLSSWFLGFRTPTYVEAPERPNSGQLVFAQCGTQIKTLNTYLESNRLALPTSGAANGQTIVGAMSTGTHGSAISVGAMQDYILGLHVVAEGGIHYWIERPSKPTMTPSFADWLGAKHVRDEDLFLSAVVGFGSFGVIHAVLFKAEPLYTLELFINQYDHATVMDAACNLNLGALGLPRGTTAPFHFEVVFNPYRRAVGDRGAFVRVLYKNALVGPPPSPPVTDGQAILSRDLVSIAGAVSDAVPALVPALLQKELLASLPPTAPQTTLATPGIQFGDTQPTHGGTSIEIAVPLVDVEKTLSAIFAVTASHTFGAPLALRYVRPSDALLAFTCHGPTTCTMEMPGVDSSTARSAHPLIFNALSAAQIPTTYHWGQQGPFTLASLVAGYGQDRVNRWLAARRKFLTPNGRAMFSNEMLDGCGLSG